LEREKTVSIISRCAVLAGLIEVSASPKPGNVHRFKDFCNTKFEHFLAGNIALEPFYRKAAEKGYKLNIDMIDFEDIRIGKLIFESSKEMLRWQSGGNVSLGIILLLIPLTVAAGYIYEKGRIVIKELRNVLRKIINNTTSEDVIFVYNAIRESMTDKTLGQVNEFDVNDEKALIKIKQNNLNLKEIFKLCEKRDMICHEWTSDFDITFNHSYPYLRKQISNNININTATINTFLYILSKYPDSLIIRKSGIEKANNITKKARKVLEAGGYNTSVGKEMVRDLDIELQKKKGMLNPGTSADLTASSLFLLLLEGWRP
jgi:triphosphoribosyl-dephospho-CoA synthase